MTIRCIDHLAVPVRDIDAELAFYRDALGFEVRFDGAPVRDQRWVEVAPPGAETALALTAAYPRMAPGSLQGLVLATTDLAAARADLAAKGVTISEILATPMGRIAVLEDPDGNGLVLKEVAG